jgi:hypothetical protein
MNFKLVGTSVIGVGLAGTLAFLCFRFGSSSEDHDLNLAIMVVATIIGWILGVLVSPYDQGEQRQFTSLARVASAFITGYLAAKVNSLIDAILSPQLLLTPLPAFRALLFVGAALLATLGTFVYRRYA